MSQPDPAPAPSPVVPYGPGASSPVPPSATSTPRQVGSTAARWGLRILLPILVRLIFRAIFRR